MSSLNQVQLIGRVGKDPESRFLPNGDCVVNFSIATSEKWKDKSTGEKMEKTEWHRCVAWRGIAEVISKHISKGSQVFVQGKLQTRKWEKDGEDRFSTEIVVDELVMLGGKREDNGSELKPQRPDTKKGSEPVKSGFDDANDDIPF